MEKALAIFGGVTAIVMALGGLLAAVNYLIRQSSLVANSLWEIKKFGFKRMNKNGSSPLVD